MAEALRQIPADAIDRSNHESISVMMLKEELVF
jgi:hypothetical protein